MWVEARGAKIYLEQTGAGRDVLLLHGWGCTTKHWEAVAKPLSESLRVTVIDFPGFGQSPEPPEVWGVEEYAQAVLEVMDALGVEKTHIVAHSFGARVAILLASLHPERVARMVLTGAAGLRPLRTMTQILRQGIFKTGRAVLGLLPKKDGEGFGEKVQARMRERYGSADYVALSALMRSCFQKIVNLDLEDRLPLVKAPTLLFWGENDGETPPWMGRLMEKRMRDAALVLYPGAGHFAYLERLGDFLKVTEHFLGGGKDD